MSAFSSDVGFCLSTGFADAAAGNANLPLAAPRRTGRSASRQSGWTDRHRASALGTVRGKTSFSDAELAPVAGVQTSGYLGAGSAPGWVGDVGEVAMITRTIDRANPDRGRRAGHSATAEAVAPVRRQRSAV